jgi:hypothetical protein
MFYPYERRDKKKYRPHPDRKDTQISTISLGVIIIIWFVECIVTFWV